MPADPPSDALLQLQDRYRALLERLETNQSDFQRLARSVMRVQEDERRRIARELHDGVGQNLTALKHQLALLQADLPPAPGDAGERVSACIDLCAQTLEDTRHLSRLLRPQVLDDLGLEAALHWLGRSVDSKGGLRVELQIESMPTLDTELQTLLFRVTQEALANVVRHARANDALVRLAMRGGRVALTVWDDGIGFEPAVAARLASSGQAGGLSGMRERVRLHGGALEIESTGNGTWLRASLPLVAAEHAGTPP
jgi:two-component system sensor histidine kinase UhpB